MEKSIFEQMGGTYRRESDHLLPNLTVPEIDSVGVWGQRHLCHYSAWNEKPLLPLSDAADSAWDGVLSWMAS